MNEQIFCRQTMLVGKQAMSKLQGSHVAVFGVGGVGTYACEALARAGVGALTLVDDDVFCLSNINRQLYALTTTVGQSKVEVAKQRIAQINPNCTVNAVNQRFDQTTENNFDFSAFDFVIDAIDTVTSKVLLVKRCNQANVNVISCMGTGNKLNPSALCVTDIYKTSVCPLAKVMRKLLKEQGVSSLTVVYSPEQPIVPLQLEQSNKRQTPSSISFVPSVAGLLLAGHVVNTLIKDCVRQANE